MAGVFNLEPSIWLSRTRPLFSLPMSIRAVIFDLGGVVFRYDPESRLANFAAHTGTPAQLIRKRLIDSGYSLDCDSGRLKGEAAYREGIRLLGHRVTMERFRDLWVSAFTPDDDVVALAQRLKARCAVALLTNNSAVVREGLELHHPDAMGVFRPQLFSSDVGISKPDPRIFDALLNLLGIEPDQALFVDDAARHIASAASIGLAVHHFRGAAGLEAELNTLELLT
jgi:HAD superfamily hydrolase (TIGR01509 family)